jgi:hypothetical protein
MLFAHSVRGVVAMKKPLSILLAGILICLPVSFCGCPKTTKIPDRVSEGPKPTAEPVVGDVPLQPMK